MGKYLYVKVENKIAPAISAGAILRAEPGLTDQTNRQ